jgi:N-acetylneuraminic acid mutarotase
MSKFLQIMTITLLVVFLCSTSSFSQTGKWTQLLPAHSPPPRASHCMAYLDDDKVLIFGGDNLDPDLLGDTWIYDLSDNEWTEVKCDSSPPPRDLSTMAQISTGKTLLFGGNLGWDYGYANDTWLFDLETMKWIELHPQRKPYRRDRASITSYGNNKILLYSGNGCPIYYSVYEDGYCHDTWIFDLEKIKWDSITNNYPRGREGAQMCEIDSNRIVLYGGWTSTKYNTDMFIFDKLLKKWIKFVPKINNIWRDYSSLVAINQNISFVFGGATNLSSLIDDSWILDMEDSTWIELNLDLKPQGRYLHKMAKITEGKVLLFGGVDKHSLYNDTWLFEYDPTGVKDSNNVLFSKANIIHKSNNICEIQISNLSEGMIDIEIYDFNGGLLKNFYSDFNIQKELNIEFNTEEFVSGSYFIVIKTKEANYYKQIFVVH